MSATARPFRRPAGKTAWLLRKCGRCWSITHPQAAAFLKSVPAPGRSRFTSHKLCGRDHLTLVERNEQFVELPPRPIEYSRSFCRHTQTGFELVHSGVEDLPESEPFDLIISGLPLNNFSVDSVEQMLSKMQRLLAPGGSLSFSNTWPCAARRRLSARRPIASDCRESRASWTISCQAEVRRDLVLANVPPAWVHHVRRRRPHEHSPRSPAALSQSPAPSLAPPSPRSLLR